MASDEITGDQTDEGVSVADDGEEDPQAALKKVISVDVTDMGVLRKTVGITVPRDSLTTEFDKEYDGLMSDALVPGFRKGHAPRKLVEKRFGRDVNEQVQTRLVSNAYLAAIDKEELKVLGDPMIWVHVKDKKKPDEQTQEKLLEMGEALPHIALPDDGDFTFRCEVEVKPEFELPELEGVPIEKPILSISDAAVQVQIDRMRAQRGNWAPVESGGKVVADDLLVCDLKVTVGGKEVKTLDNVQLAARAQVVEGAVLSDLGDALKGAKVGDSRSVEAELPEDYEVEDLRGKKATFAFSVNEIKRMQLPPLDKAYLEANGFDNEADYRQWVKSQMELQLEAEIRRGMKGQTKKYLLDNTTLELPEGLSSRQTERAAARRAIELRRQGVPAEEIDKHADELRTGAREEALAELKLYFIFEEVAEKFEVDVTEEEINGQIAQMARAYNRRFDRVRDELAKSNGIEQLYLEVRDEKCIERILDKAKITEAKPEKKAAPKQKTAAKKAATKKATTKADEDEKAEKKTVKNAAKKTTKKASKKKSQ
ncbi:MAG: trigger factor [bacterium]|nr:trigger factor [bacterium]